MVLAQPETHLQLHRIVKNVVIVAHPNLIATLIATIDGTWIATFCPIPIVVAIIVKEGFLNLYFQSRQKGNQTLRR